MSIEYQLHHPDSINNRLRRLNNIFDEIKNKIVIKYPLLKIYVKRINENWFILIDDKSVYGSGDFLDLISEIHSEILFPKKIGNIYISYLLDGIEEQIYPVFYQIYPEMFGKSK
jgi:hypothetical protein